MCLSVLAGLLFAGTLPTSANAAAGLTPTQVGKSSSASLVTKARWHGGWHGGWGHRGWGYGGWGYRRRWWGPGVYIGAWPYYGYGYYPSYYYDDYYYPYYGYYGGYGWRHRYWRHAYWGHRGWGYRRGWGGYRGGWHHHR